MDRIIFEVGQRVEWASDEGIRRGVIIGVSTNGYVWLVSEGDGVTRRVDNDALAIMASSVPRGDLDLDELNAALDRYDKAVGSPFGRVEEIIVEAARLYSKGII